MTARYEAGAVWWARGTFKRDEEERKKYIILLSDIATDNDKLVMALTTSQVTRYGQASTQGKLCGGSYYRINAGDEPCFPVATWVQFNTNVATIDRSVLVQNETAGTAGFIQTLDPGRTRGVLDCATRCEDLEDYYIKMIECALKARKSALKAGKAPAKIEQTKNPLEILLAQLAAHEAACRQNFCDMTDITLAELPAIMSAPSKQTRVDFDTASEAMSLINGQCTSCSGAKKPL